MVSNLLNPVVLGLIGNAILSYYQDAIPFDKTRYDTYDFIVIGGGTAGCVVAGRLSESLPRRRILLLERGGAAGNFYTDIPYIATQIGYGTGGIIVNTFPTVRQRKSCGENDGICTMLAGNGFGGGSSHNAMVYHRGSPLDYDDWSRVYGASGWSFQDVLPFFKSIEKYLNQSLFTTGVHGHTPTGLGISLPNDYPVLQSLLLSAYAHAGYSLGDYNGFNPAQVSFTHNAIGHGRRSSSFNTFLQPAIRRPNLDVISFASVNKIIFDSNKRATAVSYTRKDINYIARVSKEVILSAGVIDSPKLLMLSGVGDAKELSKIGVTPIVAHLPSVGKSFQDQPQIYINLTRRALSETFEQVTVEDVEEYRQNQTGVLTKSPNLIAAFFTDQFVSESYQDTRGSQEIVLDLTHDQIVVLIHVFGTRSRGSIRLASPDPDERPIIHPNYYSDPVDMAIQKRTIKNFVSRITTRLAEEGIQIKETVVRGCGMVTMSSLLNDSFLDCFIRMTSGSSIHMSSSCRMGSRRNPLSCVDPNLKVLGGIQNVRVIDASVMPQVVRGNTNAATTMIAEKGSWTIIQEYRGFAN